MVIAALPKTIVIGAKGFIGSALMIQYRRQYPDTIGTDNIDPSFPFVDLSKDPNIDGFNLSGYSYAVIAAAYPSLMMCEKEREIAYQINVRGALQLVEQFLGKGITPVLFSTDYVFDGKTGAYHEESARNPLNEYGRQKAELEQRLEREYQGRYLLVRLSKVYGLKKGDNSLLDQMFKALAAGETIRAAHDMIFSPIALEDVVEGIITLQKQGARGIYHLCGPETISRLELARQIGKAMGKDEKLIQSLSVDDLGETFMRPKRTDLISRKLNATTRKKLGSSIEILAQQYV